MLFRLGMIPMFLFSGAFFPISNLPDWLESVARLDAAVARRRPVRGCSRSGRRPTAAGAGARRLPAPVLVVAGCVVARCDASSGRLVDVSAPIAQPLAIGVAPPALAGARPATGRRALPDRAQLPGLPHAAGRSSLSGFLEPVFYLFSIGVGVGQLVGDVELHRRRAGRATPRSSRRRCSPPSAMNGALFDSTFNLFFKLKYDKLYDACSPRR